MAFSTRSKAGLNASAQGYVPLPNPGLEQINHSVTSTLDHMKTLLDELEPATPFEKGMKSYMTFLHCQFTELKHQVDRVQSDSVVRHRNTMETVDELALTCVKTEQYSRRDTVTVVGLVQPDNETQAGLTKKVAEVLSTPGDTVTETDLSVVHRNSNRPRIIKGKTDELQRTVVIDWDLSQVRQQLNRLIEEDPEETRVGSIPEDPLLYLLGRMIQHQSEIRTGQTGTLYNSLEITSIVGRGRKLVLNNARDTSTGEPLVVLHMGKERAMNIIPKKLNLAMLDVFDVQLGNFSIISFSNKTTDSMHISLPKEKSLEDDDLDLHILVKPLRRCVTISENEHDLNVCKDHTVSNMRIITSNGTGTSEKHVATKEYDTTKDQVTEQDHVQHDGSDSKAQKTSTDCVTTKDDPDEHGGVKVNEILNVSSEHDTISKHGTGEDLEAGASVELCDVNDEEHDSVKDSSCKTDSPIAHEPLRSNDPCDEVLSGFSPSDDGSCAKNDEVDNSTSPVVIKTQLKVQARKKPPKTPPTHGYAEGRFISMKSCVGVINCHKKEVIAAWLAECGIKGSKKKKIKVHKLRLQLLKHIQCIHEGKAKPTLYFVTSFLGKIPYSELLVEATRLGIDPPKKATESEIRHFINDYLTSDEDSMIKPPQLLATDEDLSSSENESEDENSLDDKTCKPQINTAKETSGHGKDVVQQTKQKPPSIDTPMEKRDKSRGCLKPSNTGHVESTSKGGKVSPLLKQKDHVPNPYEKSILTLEQSLIEVQDRLSSQELLIESLSNKPPPEQQTSTLKSLHNKNRTLFETLNTQQNSIDTLKDSLAASAKESKKKTEQNKSAPMHSNKQRQPRTRRSHAAQTGCARLDGGVSSDVQRASSTNRPDC
ncbi:hypothetical protein ACHWQZ_G009031 [Mnemiopsis leidyi]